MFSIGRAEYAEIQKLLSQLRACDGVIWAGVMAADGTMMACDWSEEIEGEKIGALALSIYMSSQYATAKMGHDRLHQVILKVTQGHILIADFGTGIIVCMTNATEYAQLQGPGVSIVSAKKLP